MNIAILLSGSLLAVLISETLPVCINDVPTVASLAGVATLCLLRNRCSVSDTRPSRGLDTWQPRD